MSTTDPTEQAKTHFFDGNAHFEAGRLEEAVAQYQAALALVPGRPSVLANLGVTQCRLGRWLAAVTTLTQAMTRKATVGETVFGGNDATANSVTA